jgi:hypothetical protein
VFTTDTGIRMASADGIRDIRILENILNYPDGQDIHGWYPWMARVAAKTLVSEFSPTLFVKILSLLSLILLLIVLVSLSILSKSSILSILPSI